LLLCALLLLAALAALLATLLGNGKKTAIIANASQYLKLI